MKRALPTNQLLQAIPPSTVVMATSVDSKGNPNIITLATCNQISSKPPMICIGVSPKRYSHNLIIESGEFAVNVPSIKLEKQMRFCGKQSGRAIDKFMATGLTPIPAKTINTPLIKECVSHLECKVTQTHICGDHTLFVGKVLHASVNEDVFIDQKLDMLRAKPIVEKNYIYYTLTKLFLPQEVLS